MSTIDINESFDEPDNYEVEFVYIDEEGECHRFTTSNITKVFQKKFSRYLVKINPHQKK